MDRIDLLSLLRVYNGTLKNVVVYGKVIGVLERPSNIFSSVHLDAGGVFVEVDVFAVDLSYYATYLKQCGIASSDQIYMVNGTLVSFVRGTVSTRDSFWCELHGTLRFGSRKSDIYVSLLNYQKDKRGVWEIRALDALGIDLSKWDKGSMHYAYLSRSGEAVIRPDAVSGLARFTGREPNLLGLKSSGSQQSSGLDSVATGGMDGGINVRRPNIISKESRKDVKPYSKVVLELREKLDSAIKLKKDFISYLKGDFSIQDKKDDNNGHLVTKYVEFLTDSLICNLKVKAHPSASTGRMLLSIYLKSFGDLATKKYCGVEAYKFLIGEIDEVRGYILDGHKPYFDGVALRLCERAFGDVELWYAAMVGIIIGVSQTDLSDVALTCKANGICFSKLINENPYALQLIGNFKFSTVEHIALCFGRCDDRGVSAYRNIALIHAYISDTDNGSTVYPVSEICGGKVGLSFSESKYMSCVRTGTYLTQKVQENIRTYLHSYTGVLGYSGSEFRRCGSTYVRGISEVEVRDAISSYVSTGMGVRYKDYLTSSRLLEKELYIYDRLHALGEERTGFSRDEIDRYIDEYEGIVGYRLESKQREAVHLIERKAGLLSGGAGSGKTTTTSCMIYVLQRLDSGISFRFAAPTGKAAKRMREVIKMPVRTMHSLFGLGCLEENIFTKDGGIESGNYNTYIFDENAMVTIDLFYSVLRKIDGDCRIYLVGDFRQLPPIGKGLPFRDLLRYMPCVFLDISKRAVSGSNITLNSDYINEYSERSNWRELVSGGDFYLLPCDEDGILGLVERLCKYYLGKSDFEDERLLKRFLGTDELPQVAGLTPDDIQVVSPIAKSSYTWGTYRLNEALQPIFNPVKGYVNTFVYQSSLESKTYVKFLVGDRVIHTDRNIYGMQWYSSFKDGVLQKMYGYGVCNGDVGKIVAFLPAMDCTIEDEVDEMPDNFSYPDLLRDDKSRLDSDDWFIIVEYYDYITDSNYYIVYRAYENEGSDVTVGRSFSGEDLSKLALFYAGTVHKLQGSQARLIISVLGVVNYSGFITRNMMYTVYTRGKDLVYAVGSVGNERGSMLSRARMEIAEEGVMTVGDLI